MAKKFTWHRNPAERTFIEKVARKFLIPDYPYRPKGYNLEFWKHRDARLKSSFPVRWFISETIPDWWNSAANKTNNVRDWIRWRVYDRYHVVKTDLEPGYYDKDEIMLHVNFKLLKDFVEIECAQMNYCDDELSDNHAKWRHFKAKVRRFIRVHSHDRLPKSGVRYLKEEIEDPYIKGTPQAVRAQEKLDLYNWWTVIRPAREDVWESPLVWKNPDDALDFSKTNKVEYDLMQKLEDFYEAEDQEMLIRLMKLRKHLWT